MDAASETCTFKEDAYHSIITSLETDDSCSVSGDITCIEIKPENDADLKTCFIEVIHNEEDCSDKYVIPEHCYIPRKLFLEQNIPIPEVRDSDHCVFFEILDASALTEPLECIYRPPKDKLVAYINDLRLRNSECIKYGVNLDYGKFDLEGLRIFEECQLKEDVLNERIWFDQEDYVEPKCSQKIDMATIKELQDLLLNFGSDDTVPLQGRFSMQTHELADLACERWINDSLIQYFVNLIQENSPQTYIVNFALVTDLDGEARQIKLHMSNFICNGQILFLSHIGIHPECDETFMSQEQLLTSHYVFGSFLFSDNKVRYADTMGLKMPSEFIEKVNFILSHFDVEPAFHYCHDPRGTLIEDEPRFISHACTPYCSKYYPLQTCTNICGVALIVGMCIAAVSTADFVEMCKPGSKHPRFAYLSSVSHYSHFLRLVLFQYVGKSFIDLNIISDTKNVVSDARDEISYSNACTTGIGQVSQMRRKNLLNIRFVSDLIQDAVLKYAKSKEKPVMQLVCRIKTTGKLVTKSFPCSPLGQDDSDCVADIQNFINSSSCREWLSSYISEICPQSEQSGKNSLAKYNGDEWCKKQGLDSTKMSRIISHSLVCISGPGLLQESLGDNLDTEPVRHNRRKNHLDISSVSDLIFDAKLKFVKIQGRPALQLGCIIKSIGKSVTKTFSCSSLGQDDTDCVAKIQEFIDSEQCVEWLNGYIKVLESHAYDGRADMGSTKLVYRKNFLDVRCISHIVSDARVRFLKSKGRQFIQLICVLKSSGKRISKIFHRSLQSQSDTDSVAMVQNFINSSRCVTWLRNCMSRKLLDINNVSNLIDDAKLKYLKIKGKPMVQLICQMKSTRKLVKKTFPCSSLDINGDCESVAEIQKYMDSSSCTAWLNRCNNRIPSGNITLDISNISDLVDEAKLKFQNTNNKPTMQLVCHLTSNQKAVSKNFPCSALGARDEECITKIQNYVNSMDCLAWLYRFIIKNPPIDFSPQEKPLLNCKVDPDSPSPSSLGRSDPDVGEEFPTIKMEIESDSELLESCIEIESGSPLSVNQTDSKAENQSFEFGKGPPLLKQPIKDVADCEDDNLFIEKNQLDLKNVSDLLDDVKLKLVKVNGKSKICLFCQIKYTKKIVKKYLPYSNLGNGPNNLIIEAQNFINSNKCLKWLSKSINYLSGKASLDVQNISDLIEYAKLRYVKFKGKPLMYLLCRIKSNRKLVRKAFPCALLGRDYVRCISEIQNFINSSNCRTWLSVYSGKNPILDVQSARENEHSAFSAQSTVDSVQSINQLSIIGTNKAPVSKSIDEKKLDIENILDLVHDAKLRFTKVKSKPMLQLVCQITCTKKFVTKCFPCSSLGHGDVKCVAQIQKFISSSDCLKWLHKCIEKYPPVKSENVKTFHNLCIQNTKELSTFSLQNAEKVPVSLQNTEISPVNLQNEGKTPVNLQSKEKLPVNLQSTESQLPNRKPLDVGNIHHLIYSAELIFVNIKGKPLVQLLCQIGSTGKLVTKSFSCSSRGLDDGDCIATIQNFINSAECLTWLDSYVDKNSSNLQTEEKGLNNEPYKLYIVGKPEIYFIKPNTLRLVCHLKNGRTKCKAFKCNSEGRNDKTAMKAIDDFLNGNNVMEWIVNDKDKEKRGEEWKFSGYVKTGIDTKRFVDNITFDVNQSFILNKRGNFEVIIHRDKHCNKESIVENPTWGTTHHRLDDTYSLKEGPVKNSIVAVYLLLSCASKTDACRTECGKLIKEVNIIDNSLTCCGHLLQGYNCTNCHTYTTPQWCRKKNNVILCKNCDMYLRTHGTDRPRYLWKESTTTNFKHLKCKWKLKLVLRSGDMSRWHIYRSVCNDQSHDRVIQDRKRPSLNIKDEWYSSKVKEFDKPTKRVLNIRKRKRAVDQPHAARARYTHSEMQEDPRNILVFKAAEDFKQELYQVECTEENVQYLETCEDYVHDGGVITEEVANSVEDTGYHCDEGEGSSSLPSQKRLKVEKTTGENEKEVESREASMVCVKCIKEGKTQIFGCSSKKEMDVHISECHKEEQFACAACYTKDHVVITFLNESLFREHQKIHAPKRTM